jgi:hypothetical protein
MAFGHARFPVRRPGRVERIIAAYGFLVGQEEAGLDMMALERIGNQLGLRLAAGIKGEIDVPLQCAAAGGGVTASANRVRRR